MKITIIAECGEKTCAVEPGQFCRFVHNEPGSFGQRSVCSLYEKPIRDPGSGWLMRLRECLLDNFNQCPSCGQNRTMRHLMRCEKCGEEVKI